MEKKIHVSAVSSDTDSSTLHAYAQIQQIEKSCQTCRVTGLPSAHVFDHALENE